jgi:putative ABC transport system ATP-binding protein
MALLQVRNLSKVYQRDSQAIPVFEDIDLDIDTGEFLVLMGPSGSGKTTLLNLIAGLDEPTTGTITVGGEEVTAMSRRQLAAWRSNHVGFIFQLYNLLPVLTAYQNVELPLLLTHLSKQDRGQEQRVAIGRAIVSDPTLILADEPTGDLDAKSADEILTLMQRLNREFEKTILLVTHDQRAAERGEAIMHLDKGVLTR